MARGTQWVVLALAIAWTSSARATPDFPALVVKELGLPGITIDPPQGCTLCHPTDAGGTSLQPFGQLLQQYGAQPYDESSLEQALAEVEQNEPQLVADIKNGRNPNDDAGAADLHSPQYGCALGGHASERPTPALVALAAIALAGWMRRRRGSSELRP
jgi:MYXO-CTERM domain-containing protein